MTRSSKRLDRPAVHSKRAARKARWLAIVAGMGATQKIQALSVLS